MARLRAEDVLKRYAAGERDFRGADLQGLRFRRACLAGADFSKADLRGTDFLEADLRGAQFVNAICGVSPIVLNIKLFCICIVGAAAALLAGETFNLEFQIINTVSQNRAIAAPILLILASALAAIFAKEGVTLRSTSTLVASVPFLISVSVLGSMISAIIYIGRHDFFSWLVDTLYTVLTGNALSNMSYGDPIPKLLQDLTSLPVGLGIVGYPSIAIAGFVAYTGALANLIAGFPGVAFASLGGVAFLLIKSYTNGDSLNSHVVRFILFLAFLLIGTWSSRQGSLGYAGIAKSGIAIGCLGGTTFVGADLRESNFHESQLARTNFYSSPLQHTKLECVSWVGAVNLHLARFCDSMIADRRIQKLVISRAASGENLRGLNLRGVYLPEAELRGVDLREVNLSEAVLKGAHLENANLKASQCLGTNFQGAHLTGATLEGWNIDHTTNLRDIDCAYVYLLEPLDAQGQRRDDHHRERLPHDPDKTFGPGDFETYFKQVIEEVKLLIKNGVDAKAFLAAFQEVMRLHPLITPESLTGIHRMGDDVLATLQVPAEVDKGEVERDFFAEYNAETLRNAKLSGLLEGERRVNEVQRTHNAQLVEIMGKLVSPSQPPTPAPSNSVNQTINFSGVQTNATHNPAVTNTTIHAGDGNLINTGTLDTGGGMVHLGDLSDQARIAINALPDQRLSAEEPSLRELLQQLQASLDGDQELPVSSRADALSEIHTIATAAQEPQQNFSVARRAIHALKGISASITEANKALEVSSQFVATVKKLLPLITAFFQG